MDENEHIAGTTRILPPRDTPADAASTPAAPSAATPNATTPNATTPNLSTPNALAPNASAPRSPAWPEPSSELAQLHLSTVPPGRYINQREFARGGLGRILRAHDVRMNRTVAIKELHFNHPAAEARFAREVRVTARLQHPNIIPVHDAGRWPQGPPFFTMKFVEGESLAEVIKRRQSFAQRVELLDAVISAAEAMAYAHSEGIIHRDLKPANVLIGPFGETVVIDWGLAKDLKSDEEDPAVGLPPRDPFTTTDGVVVGTPAYMPPEQAHGDAVDATADVYALGALLYHVIAGHTPYAQEGSGEDILHLVQERSPLPLAQLAPEAPPDLVAIAERAMARNPRHRYPTAREMAEELKAFTTGRLVGAYRYSSWELIRRFVRRQRTSVTIAALAVVVLVALGVTSVNRIAVERDRAERTARAEARARAEAERNLDRYVMERADSLLTTDPTAAAAELKTLRQPLPGAATVAARANETGVAYRVYEGHKDQIESLAFSPDGTWLVSGGRDSMVWLWPADGRGPGRQLGTHRDQVTQVSFLPDSRRVISSGYDGAVRLWEIHNGTFHPLQEPPVETPGERAIRALALDGQGRQLSALGDDQRMRHWDLAQGDVARVVQVPVDRETFAQYAWSGSRLLTGSHQGRARLWLQEADRAVVLSRGAEARVGAITDNGAWVVVGDSRGGVHFYRGHDGGHHKSVSVRRPISAVAFSPTGAWVAAADVAGNLWRMEVEGSRVERLEGHSAQVSALAFSPDGRLLASAGWDTTVMLHDLPNRTVRKFRGHGTVVSALAFSPAGERLATASWDKTVRLWSLHRYDSADRRMLMRHRGGARAVAYSPDGEWVASAGHDHRVRLMSLGTGEVTTILQHDDHVSRVVFDPTGRYVASAGDDQTVRVYNRHTQEVQVLRGHRAQVDTLVFSPHATKLASAGEDNAVILWSLDGAPPLRLEHPRNVADVVFTLGGELLATAGHDGNIRLWSTATGERFQSLAGHQGEVRDLELSPDGMWLASASTDDTVRLWNLGTGASQILPEMLGARRVVFSHDGRIGVAGLGSSLAVCSLATTECVTLVGHRAKVNDLAFTPDGRFLITAGDDRKILLWDTTTGEYHPMIGHELPVFDLALDPSGHRFVSASADGTVRMWPVLTPPEPSELQDYLNALTLEEP